MTTRQYVGPFTASGHPIFHTWNRAPLDGNLIYVRIYIPRGNVADITPGDDSGWRRIGEAGSDPDKVYKYRRQWNTGDNTERIEFYDSVAQSHRVRMWEVSV